MTKQKIRNLCILLSVLIILTAVPLQLLAASEARPAAKDVPTGTLIIGSHLIHIKGLNNELLTIAQASAEDASQNNVYYRSEFAGGTWFDITSASGLIDISTAGKPVENSLIDGLTLTHWTRGDGTTVELSTGKIVDIHKIEDGRNLSLLSELVELKTRKELLTEGEKNDDNTNKLRSISGIIDVPLTSAEYDSIEKQMDAMEGYINYLRNKKAPEDQVSLVVDLKGGLNTKKLLVVYNEALERLNKESIYAEKVITEKDDDEEKVIKAAYTDLSSAYSTCIDAVSKKISELENELSTAPASSALEREKSRYETELVSASSGMDYKTADIKLAFIVSINNILAGKVIDTKHELSILDPLVISETDSLVKNSSTIPSAYSQAVKRGDTAQLIDNKKKEYLAELTSQADDILAMIGYIKLRKGNSDELTAIIKQVRDKCVAGLTKIPAGSLKTDTSDTLKKLIDALNAELAAIQGESTRNPLSDTLNNIDASIKELTDEYLTALDEGNMNLAKSLKDEIDSLLAQKDAINKNASLEKAKLLEKKAELQEQLSAAMADGNSALTGDLLDQLAAIDASLGAQSSLTDAMSSANASILDDLYKQLTDSLNSGDYQQALSLANEIAGMYENTPPDSAAKVSLAKILPSVKSKLDNALDQSKIKDASQLQEINNLLSSLLSDAVNNTAGLLDGNYSDADDTALQNMLNAMLQELLASLGADESSQYGLIIKIKILEVFLSNPEYHRIRYAIEELQSETAAALRGLNQKIFISDHITKVNSSNVNLRAFADASGMRMVWRTENDEAFLTKGRIFVKFTNASSRTIDNEGLSEEMGGHALVSGNRVYVPTKYITVRMGYSYLLLDTSGDLLIYPSSIDSIVEKAMNQ